jgi:hypothetical protein
MSAAFGKTKRTAIAGLASTGSLPSAWLSWELRQLKERPQEPGIKQDHKEEIWLTNRGWSVKVFAAWLSTRAGLML